MKVALHTHQDFWPNLKILVTQKWPKTAQNRQFWGILRQKLHEIPPSENDIIGAVALHTLRKF